MSGRIINPFQQFRGNGQGLPLAAGTIEFFENNTIVQKTIFSDADLTVPQTNPYTLDAAGRITGDVFLDGLYTIEIRDSAGAFIRSIDDVETGGAGGGSGDAVTNKSINGAMQVVSGSSISVSAVFQDAPVIGYAVRAINSSAGSIDQETTTNFTDPSSGKSLIIRGLTTGTGGTAEYRKRINSDDSFDLANDTGTFSCRVFHNTGVAVNYEIFLNSADAVNDFSSVTNIASSGAITVNTATPTTIDLIAAMGANVINGLEIIVVASIGAVTSRNYETTEWLMERSSSASSYDFILFEDELARIQAVQALAPVIDVAPASTENALVVENSQPLKSLADGLAVFARLDHAANTATAVTLQIDSLTPRGIFRTNNQDPLVGDTGGASNVCVFFYDLSLDKFFLTNPAGGSSIARGTTLVEIPVAATSIDFDIAGTQEMTLNAAALTLATNNIVLTAGDLNSVNVTASARVQGSTVVSVTDFEAGGSTTVPTYNFTGGITDGIGLGTSGGIQIYDASVSIVSADGASIRVTPPIQGEDGTSLIPTFSFLNDPDTGVLLSTTNTMGFSAGGTVRLTLSDTQISPNIPIVSSSTYQSTLSGTAALPNYRAVSATTGLFGTANTVGLSVLTVNVAESTNALWTFGVPVAMGANAIAGSGSISMATVTATTALQSDIWRSSTDNTDQIVMSGATTSFRLNSVEQLSLSTSRLSLTPGGSAAAPGFEFASTATGQFYTASSIGFSVSGTELASIDTSGIRTASIASSNSLDERLFIDNSGFRFEVNAVGTLVISSSDQVIVASGTAALPGLSFLDDQDTGFSESGANILVSRNAAEIGRFNADGWTPISALFRSNQEAQGIYPVLLDGVGNIVSGPSGWTSSAPGSGAYTITHNLGTTNYIYFVLAKTAGLAGSVVGASQDTKTANLLAYATWESDGSGGGCTRTDVGEHQVLVITF